MVMRNTWLMMEKSPNRESTPFTARFESIGRRLPETRLSSEDLMATVVTARRSTWNA
jgi:hypothetical protein